MKTLFACVCVLVLSASLASAQSAPAKILVLSRTQPAAAGGDAESIARFFEKRVAELLMQKYPCAQTMAMSELAAWVEWDRQRALLDSSYEGAFASFAKALDASYYVSMTVSRLPSGQFSLNGAVIDAARIQTVDRSTVMAGGGAAAVDALEALAQKLVQGLSGIKRLSSCGGVWVGTLVYRKTSEVNENEASSGDEVNRTRRKVEYEATVTVGPTGAKASVKSSLAQSRESITRSSVNCARRPGFDDPDLKVLTRERSEYENASVEGTVDAKVGITVTGDQARISFAVPAVEGGTMVGKKKVSDGLCEGPSVQDIPDVTAPWSSSPAFGEVTAKFNPRKPDELSGTQDVEGATFQWTLSKR